VLRVRAKRACRPFVIPDHQTLSRQVVRRHGGKYAPRLGCAARDGMAGAVRVAEAYVVERQARRRQSCAAKRNAVCDDRRTQYA